MKRYVLIAILLALSIRQSFGQSGIDRFSQAFAKHFYIDRAMLDTATKIYFFSIKITVDKNGYISKYKACDNANKAVVFKLDETLKRIDKGILKSSGIKGSSLILPIIVINTDSSANSIQPEQLVTPWQFDGRRTIIADRVLQPIVVTLDVLRPSELLRREM